MPADGTQSARSPGEDFGTSPAAAAHPGYRMFPWIRKWGPAVALGEAGSILVFVVAAYPGLGMGLLIGLVAPVGGQIEIVIGAIQHVDAALVT
jgi:hypothetical protein